MTISATRKPKWTVALGIPFLIFVSCFVITLIPTFKTNRELLSNGILIDLLITAPIIYLLAIRRSNVSKLTVSRIFIAGLFVAGFILNGHQNSSLHIIQTWIAPVIESLVVFMVGRKFYIADKVAKAANKTGIDFLIHCRSVMLQVTRNNKFSTIISSEIAVIYYAFFGSKKLIDYKTSFSSYKENGLLIVLGAILSIFLIETAGMHFLVSLWNKTIAWIITGLSFYTCIQLYGHIKAIRSRPIIIDEDTVEIHNGLAGDAYVKFDNIEKIELTKKNPVNRKWVKIALLEGLENHNVVVYLKKPIFVTKIFGIKKRTDTILFFVDRSEDFFQSIESRWKG